MFAGPMNPGAALIVNSFGTNTSANTRDRTLSHKLDPLKYLVFLTVFFVIKQKNTQKHIKLQNVVTGPIGLEL